MGIEVVFLLLFRKLSTPHELLIKNKLSIYLVGRFF